MKQVQIQDPAQKKGFNWDLFLGRLIGSCVVGCWVLSAILIGVGVYFLIMALNLSH